MATPALAEAKTAQYEGTLPFLDDPEYQSLDPKAKDRIAKAWFDKNIRAEPGYAQIPQPLRQKLEKDYLSKALGKAPPTTTPTTLPASAGPTPAPGQPPAGLSSPLELLRGIGKQVGEAILGPEENLGTVETTDPYGIASTMGRGLVRSAVSGATLSAVPAPTPEQVPGYARIPAELAGTAVLPIGGTYKGIEALLGKAGLKAGTTGSTIATSAVTGGAVRGGAAAIQDQPIFPAVKAGVILGGGLGITAKTASWIYRGFAERATRKAGDADMAAKLDFLTKQDADFAKPEPMVRFDTQPVGMVGSSRELRTLHGPIVDTDPRRAILTTTSILDSTTGERIVLGKGQPVIIEGVRNDNALLVRFEDRGQSAILQPGSLEIVPQAIVSPGVPAQQVVAQAKGSVVVTRKVSDEIPVGMMGQIESLDSAGNATIRLASGDTQVVPANALRFTAKGEVRYGGVGPIEQPGMGGAREIRQGPFTLEPQRAEDVIQLQAGSALPPAPKGIPAVPSKTTVLRGQQALPEWPSGSAHNSIVGPAELEKTYLDTMRRRIDATLRKGVRQLAKTRADELLKQGKSGEPIVGDVELLDPTGFKQSLINLEQRGDQLSAKGIPPWLESNINQLVETADRLRITDDIEKLARSGLTAKQISMQLKDRLIGIDNPDSLIRAVRSKRNIPSIDEMRSTKIEAPTDVTKNPDAALRDRMKFPMSYDELKAVREKSPPIDDPPTVGKDVTLQMGISPHQVTDTMKTVAGILHKEFGSPYEILGRHDKGNRLWQTSFAADRDKSMFLANYSQHRDTLWKFKPSTPQFEEVGKLTQLAEQNGWDTVRDLPAAIQQRFAPEIVGEWSSMRQMFDLGGQIADRARPEALGNRKISGYFHHVFDQEQRVTALQDELAGLELLQSKGQLSTLEQGRLKTVQQTLEAGFRGRYIPGDVIPQNLMIGFLERRTGAEGYTLNYQKAVDSYYLQLARMVYDEPALKQMSALGARIEPGPMRDYAQWYIKRWYFGERDSTGLDNLARAITGFEYLWRIGGNFRTAVQNATQHINTVAKIGPTWTAKGFQEAFSEEGERLWAKSGHATDVDKLFWYELPPEIKKLTDAAGWMFRKVETGNRKVAYLGAYNQALAEGERMPFVRKLLTDGQTLEQAASQYGDKIVQDTQFLYGRVGTSKMLGTPTGRVAFQFGSYSVKQIEYLYGLMKDDPKKLFAYLMASGGINYGLYQGLGLDFSTALGLGMGYGDGLNALSSLMTGDLERTKYYGKLAVAPLVSGGGLFPSGPGPFIRDLVALKNLETDQLLPTQLKRFVEAARALPEGMRTGNYPIFEQVTGDKSESLRVRLSGTELFARTFIARSATEEKEIRERRATRYSQEALEALYKSHPEMASNPEARARGQALRQNLTPSERQLLRNKYPQLYRQYLER